MTKRIPSDCIEPTQPDGTVPPNGTVGVVTDGQLIYQDVGTLGKVLLPLTTSIGGTPGLVWDANDELVLTEVTP